MDKRELYKQHKEAAAKECGNLCVCVGVTKETIREAISSGAKSVNEVKAQTGAGSGCSLCEPIFGDLIEA